MPMVVSESEDSFTDTDSDTSIVSNDVDMLYVSNIDSYIFGNSKNQTLTLEEWFSLCKFVAQSYLKVCSGRFDMPRYSCNARERARRFLDQWTEQILKIQNDLLAYFGCNRLYNDNSRRQIRRRRRIRRFVVKMLVYLFQAEWWATKGNRPAAVFLISILKPLSHCQRIQNQIDDIWIEDTSCDLSEIDYFHRIATLNNWQRCDLVDRNFIKTRVRKLHNAINASLSALSINDWMLNPFETEKMHVYYSALLWSRDEHSIEFKDLLKKIRRVLPFLFWIDAFARDVLMNSQLSEASKALLL